MNAVPIRLEDGGLQLKQPKCSFMLESVEYLGHNISAEGLCPIKKKIRAIMDVRTSSTECVAITCLLRPCQLLWQVSSTQLSSTLAPSPSLPAARETTTSRLLSPRKPEKFLPPRNLRKLQLQKPLEIHSRQQQFQPSDFDSEEANRSSKKNTTLLMNKLEKQTKWTWGPAQKKAYREAKTQLTSSSLLVHYDPQKEVSLAWDASHYGVGAELSHLFHCIWCEKVS